MRVGAIGVDEANAVARSHDVGADWHGAALPDPRSDRLTARAWRK